MPLSRRAFVQTVGIGAAALGGSWITGRGRENSLWSAIEPSLQAVQPGMICISSNENPVGPGEVVLKAVRATLEGGTQPGRYSGAMGDMRDAIAKKFNVKPENVLLGCGSTQILRSMTQLYTAKDAPLVGTLPTYEECSGYAELIGNPVRGVALDSELKVDLDRMLAAAKGSGMIFYNNPNNPTATAVGSKDSRDFFEKVHQSSPKTTILVDEAYCDYVTDPSYETQIPLALTNPRIVVARTFSKAYGMAGLRAGYAIGHPDTIKQLAQWDMATGTSSLNLFGMAAATAAIQQPDSFITNERARNTKVRDMVAKFFKDRGMKPTDGQANFMFVNIGRPAKEFRDACRTKGVLVARDFPPFEKTHCRISLGTMEEMQKALKVFDEVLGTAAKTAAA